MEKRRQSGGLARKSWYMRPLVYVSTLDGVLREAFMKFGKGRLRDEFIVVNTTHK